jgi:ubiquinone/menaquinone biosynthesis C-methylase UbiE
MRSTLGAVSTSADDVARKRIMTKLKPDIKIVRKGRLCHILESDNRLLRFKPWLGDSFSFLYDLIMNKSIFPKKFGGDIRKHYSTLSQTLAGIHGRRVLELGTGSGSAVHFINNDNQYTGTDISPGLLKIAEKKFMKAGFSEPEFFVVTSDDLPFDNGTFEVCICILSLNFIGNVEKVFQELSRTLISNGLFFCSVPVPERNRLKSKIRGVLYSETELEKISQKYGFRFEPIPCENGALLYFKAIKKS